MSENTFKSAREITKDINYKYPDTYIPLNVLEESLIRFFEEETRHGAVYIPANHDASICINLTAFTKGVSLIFAKSAPNSAKTIEAKVKEKKYVLRITIDGDPPSRADLAVISKVMYIAGFELTSYKNVIELAAKLSERHVMSLYAQDVENIYQRLRYEFMFV